METITGYVSQLKSIKFSGLKSKDFDIPTRLKFFNLNFKEIADLFENAASTCFFIFLLDIQFLRNNK